MVHVESIWLYLQWYVLLYRWSFDKAMKLLYSSCHAMPCQDLVSMAYALFRGDCVLLIVPVMVEIGAEINVFVLGVFCVVHFLRTDIKRKSDMMIAIRSLFGSKTYY